MEHFLHKESRRISRFTRTKWSLIIDKCIWKNIWKIYSREDWADFVKNNYYVALSMLFVYEEEITQ